jgi:antitoxin component YwqK of YwqJK toxin-antitoxin module
MALIALRTVNTIVHNTILINIKQIMNLFLIKTLSFCVVFCSLTTIYGQDKIVYFDENLDTVLKSEAKYYRTAMKQNGSRYEFKDYYINGKLQFEGGSASDTEDILEGFCKWYYPNGVPMQSGYYCQGKKNGEMVWFHEDGHKLARGMYENDEEISGTFLTIEKMFREINDVDDSSNGKVIILEREYGTKARYEYYAADSFTNYTYYDQNGIKIGDAQVNSETEYTINGVEVSYYYNPMTVAAVAEVKNGFYTEKRINYYGNGEIKYVEYVNPPDKDGNQYPKSYIFYDKNGKKLDSVICNNKRRDTGNYYQFYKSKKAHIADQIEQIIPHKDAYRHGKCKTFYKNGALESVYDYEWDKIHGWKITYDSLSGKEIYKMMYVQGLALNGTEKIGDTIREIKNNNIISEIVLFDNGKTKYKKTATNYDEYYIQYYSYNGMHVGTCSFKNNSPINGDLVNYFGNETPYSTLYVNGRIEGKNIYYGSKLLYTGKTNGIQKMFDPLSDKTYTCTMKDGVPYQGTYITYLNGNIAEITEYSNGKKNSIQVKYNYDKAEQIMKPEYEVFYVDDILNGPFTYYTNVHAYSKGVFNNNQLNGIVTYFNTDGSVKTTLEYVNGKAYNGIETSFFSNGSVLSEFEYNNYFKSRITHLEYGVVIENTVYSAPRTFKREVFYSDGRLKENFTLVNGLLEGEYKTYNHTDGLIGVAKFKKGQFASGTLAFFDEQFFNNDYLTLTIVKRKIIAKYISSDGDNEQINFRYSSLGRNKYEGIIDMLRIKYTNIDFEKIKASDIEE